MSESEQSNIVEFSPLQLPAIDYGDNVSEVALAELTEQYKDPDASTDDGYEHCKDGCRTLTHLRTSVETRRLDLKRPVVEWIRTHIDKRGKDLIRQLKVIEAPVRVEKERIDEIKQAEARKAAEAELRRVDDIHANIEKIAATACEQNPNDTAADYQQHMAWLTELAITDEVFGEFVNDAKTERDAALFKLGQWHERAEQREADDRQRKADQARLDKERQELEAAQEKQREAEAKLEKENSEADEREATAKAEREKNDREAEQRKANLEKAEQEKNDREEREAAKKETDRIDCIKGFIGVILESPTMYEGLLADAIDVIITQTQEKEPTEDDFAEFLPEAMLAWKTSIAALEVMATKARRNEEQARRDDEARLPDRDKLLRWCNALAEIPQPEVLNEKAQKILRRYSVDLTKLVQRLRSDIGKL